ncbi:MAG: pyrroline-5-carboxylate reductase [Chloroflexi bacterium GWB2_49_20]|nr:MAG: pyrroline-5-carboxylate reductase [Chloroflexi bacterium GWB2_49_20]OGN77760.1 MAG: pyrroline-5-carboxylate reductase [Chloroflexi bacterium GWC2_49_37]OGN86535.1 MAG: pyrroline-5-carboxylate reductase [Chloroflexi bacterium GWD2_49_16]HBG74790.1 pyrroline-5-carboxylate reductase [Anaerolineae bacterium]
MNRICIAIIGAGNIGTAIADGLAKSGHFLAEDITLTRRRIQLLDGMKEQGFNIGEDNREAVRKSKVVILAVEPLQINKVLEEIAPELKPESHILISVITGVNTGQITRRVSEGVAVVRAMPNTAIAVRESMTCIASDRVDGSAIDVAKSIFDTVGKTIVIDEEEMIAATALGACGIAFFLRAIRAASQGGIEIGFHSLDALKIAAQTALGAATLLLTKENHPEYEIDRVTTPRGCTIAGLNQMEHEGFSSAMIKGITVSADRASKLYSNGGNEK